jgi:hypothetical protein
MVLNIITLVICSISAVFAIAWAIAMRPIKPRR